MSLVSFAFAGDPSEDFTANGVTPYFLQSHALPFNSEDTVLFENVKVGNDRYAVIMEWDNRGKGIGVLKPVWSGKLNQVEIPFQTIVIDGNDEDWAGISPVVEDPEGDENPEYEEISGTDLANVYIARDDDFLYFQMTMYDGEPVAGMYRVEFQQYLTQLHTPGDLSATAENNGTNWNVYIDDRGPGHNIATYPSEYVGVGSNMVEWMVPIKDMQLPEDTPHPYFNPLTPPPGIENQFIRTYIHPSPHPESSVSDANNEFTRPIIVNFYD